MQCRTAACAIATGRYRRVLIVCSEIASVGLNRDDMDTAPLFGDGAAALVLVLGADSGDSGSQLLAAHLETYSEGIEHCRVRAGGTRLRLEHGIDALRAGSLFEMNGRANYRLAAAKLPGLLQRLLHKAGVELAQLQRIVPHQASATALWHLQVALRRAPDTLVNVIGERGNQMAASIPSALHQAIASGRIVRGGRAMIDVCCVESAVAAALAALRAEHLGDGRAYNISNGTPIAVRDLLTQLFAALQLRVRLLPVPRRLALALALATLGEQIALRRRGQPEPRLSRYGIGVLGYSQTLDISRARRELGYAARRWRPAGSRRWRRYCSIRCTATCCSTPAIRNTSSMPPRSYPSACTAC
ncbi:3-oxoacyl-[acyl-carrier-protein] synthase III C-terminal domain-containing protein [Xanthomonas cerealis]|uniref:3-oxoacyl-[acyl-carrier-protein] synthase III C-terminal domain-containing protein n=1 Tax=Xanthomonas cerealis TaxID=3390025 RepID=UPI001F3CF510|nr:3-oxoacyl-[acyl-carrier-protein] synthase III C-terminal domain-containing protein [Xanthomonas translucens]